MARFDDGASDKPISVYKYLDDDQVSNNSYFVNNGAMRNFNDDDDKDSSYQGFKGG